MSQQYDFVVIGNSAAGLQAVRTLRKHDQLSTVALIDREKYTAYSRVLTPYYIGGHILRDDLNIVDFSFYQQLGITPVFGQAVISIDPEKHSLELADGNKIAFKKLLLATGAEARTLPTSTQRACVLRHIDDAEKLVTLFQGVTSVTAVGAGLVSLPLLSHASDQAEKHLVVGSNRIFSRVVDAETSAILEDQLKAKGLNIHKQNDISEMVEGKQLLLKLSGGEQLSSDLLIVGKGVNPNTHLANSAGLETATGVLINDNCCSSHPDIYAAGDAAEGLDFITGEKTVQGNWMTAVEQGENAALNMLGIECRYQGSMKNNITEIFGIDVAAVGYCQDDVATVVSSWNSVTGRSRRVFLDEKQRVVGANLIGETNDAGLYYQLINTRSVFPGKQMLDGTANYSQVQLRLAS
ncbi:FAD-dependent oxidoreductase [uncultured Desulfuromusa sp.]|uniref:NAD(P)/FAD-dependent oxidoreductase n=1 Tax=uncultured Desulfuromusa sp. TaxID=219183 RepID=UPI002AA75608|nr:FAD-dependent oxidoreductase [uncultured Desulfuromusa sp.]